MMPRWLPPLLVLLLLGVAGCSAQASTVVSVVQAYFKWKHEMDRYLATPTDQRRSDNLFRALRGLAQSWASGSPPTYLKHYTWMTVPPYDDCPAGRSRCEPPPSSNQMKDIADQWVCARLADSFLVSIDSYDRHRWLFDDAFNGGNHQALALDVHDAIARLHEATQVQIALEFGLDDAVVRPKYMALFQSCVMAQLYK